MTASVAPGVAEVDSGEMARVREANAGYERGARTESAEMAAKLRLLLWEGEKRYALQRPPPPYSLLRIGLVRT